MTEEDRLREFLLAIHMDQGKVCPEFETCDHVACRSNVAMWEMADAALQGLTIEQYRQEKAQQHVARLLLEAGKPLAVLMHCFKCGARGVVVTPAPGAPVCCPKCKHGDIVFLDMPVERTPDGRINNCARAGRESVDACQICCGGVCPDEVAIPRVRRTTAAASLLRHDDMGIRHRDDDDLPF